MLAMVPWFPGLLSWRELARVVTHRDKVAKIAARAKARAEDHYGGYWMFEALLGRMPVKLRLTLATLADEQRRATRKAQRQARKRQRAIMRRVVA